MKTNQLITFLLIILIIFSCSKDEPIVEPPKETPKVTTKVYENLTHDSVTLIGEVTSEGSSSIIEQGFYYTEGNSIEKKIIVSTNGTGVFKTNLDISPVTSYSYWAFAKNSVNEQRGNQLAFTSEQDPRISPSSNFVLKTQNEVDEFVKKGMLEIGSLALGEDNVINDITDISKLNTITKVLGDFKILNTKIKNTDAFENLVKIKGDLIIQGNDELESIDKMGQIEILDEINPFFYKVTIKSNLKLKIIKNLVASTSKIGFLTIENNAELTSIEGLNRIEKIITPQMTQAQNSIVIQNNKNLKNLQGLENIKDAEKFIIKNNESLESIDGLNQNFESLIHIILDTNVNLVNIDALSSYSRASYIYLNNLPNLRSLNGLKNISEVTLRLQFSTNSSHISNLDDLSNLKSVYNLYIYDTHYDQNGNATTFNQYIKNINGISNIEECSTMGLGFSGITEFPKFSNLSKINSLQISANTLLTSIDGFDNLEEITEEFYVGHNYSLKKLSGFNNLTTTKNFKLLESFDLESINGFEKLKTVEGDFVIYDSEKLNSFQKIQAIETIKGNLSIDKLIKIEDLDWLSNLKTVEGNLKIISCSSLKNLCGLQNLLSNDGLKGSYTVSSNLFNPTKQEIIDGNCSQ